MEEGTMPVKADGSLHGATRKAITVPEDRRVDARGIAARFIGTKDPLKGWDTACRILQVTDARTGGEVNDAIDVGEISIRMLVVGDGDDYEAEVDYYDGYYLDIEGPVPAGVPTSEHTSGADFAREHSGDTQPHLRDLPQHRPEVPLLPGEPALHGLAQAGAHGAPVPDEEKALRAAEAQAARDEAARLSALGTGGAAPPVQAEAETEPADAGDEEADQAAAFTRVLQKELEKDPANLEGALARAEEVSGLKVAPAGDEEPKTEDV